MQPILIATLAAIVGLSLCPQHAVADAPPPTIFRDGECVLFQGDSITDGNRGRNLDPNHVLGHSYAFLIAARYGFDHPQQNVRFFNRGVSGNMVGDLAKRWKKDALDLRPDVVSILVGINDVGLTFKKGGVVSVEKYEETYDRLLADTVATRPRVRFVLCEPFFLPGQWVDDRPADWAKTVGELRAVVARLGEKYHAPVVPLQAEFDAALKRAPFNFWIWDGIHPTYAGHQLIADAWVRTYRAFYGDATTTRPAPAK